MHLHFLLQQNNLRRGKWAGEATEPGRLAILNARRNAMLDEIHFREKQLDRLNYLRYEIQKKTAAGINAPKL